MHEMLKIHSKLSEPVAAEYLYISKLVSRKWDEKSCRASNECHISSGAISGKITLSVVNSFLNSFA